jgi:hypothetical protein
VQVRLAGGSGLSTQSPPMSQVSDVATGFLESSIEDDSPGGNHVQVATVDLSGQLDRGHRHDAAPASMGKLRERRIAGHGIVRSA